MKLASRSLFPLCPFYSRFLSHSLRILFKKKKKNCNSVSFTRAWIYKLDLGRCRTSPLCRRKNSRDTPSIFYLKKRETANRRDISIFFFFFANYFSFSIFIYLLFLFLFLSPGCSSSIAISLTLIDRSWTLIPNISESGALDINLVSSLSRFRNSGFHSSLSPTRSYVAWPFVFSCIPFVWPRSIFARFHGYDRYIESRTRGEHLSVISPSKFAIPPS